MKNKFKKKDGFTLIEVVVGVGLFAIISMVLVSIMIFSIKLNYINKDSYDADSYSKAFFEAIKNESCKPTTNLDGRDVIKCYFETFDNIEEVGVYSESAFSNIHNNTANLSTFDPTSASEISGKINDITNNAPASDKIGFMLWTNWDNTNKVYQIESWTWNLEKRESTLINRKTLLAPKS